MCIVYMWIAERRPNQMICAAVVYVVCRSPCACQTEEVDYIPFRYCNCICLTTTNEEEIESIPVTHNDSIQLSIAFDSMWK